jgi:hypothetical protein
MIRSTRGIAAVALVASAVLAGCSPSAPPAAEPPADTASASPSTGSPSVSPSGADGSPAPLTGQPVSPGISTRSAVAVAVAGSSPVGLDRADIVLEEISTPIRWVAVFQSRDAATVGPVATTRPADTMILGVLRPAYAFRGGPTGMVQIAESSSVLAVNSVRRPDRFTARGADLFASTTVIRSGVRAPAALPLLVYAEPDPIPAVGAKPARQVVLTLPRAAAQTWRYDDKAKLWRRVSGGPAVAAANLIVQTVPYKQAGRAGAEVPSARVFGSGASTVFPGPSAISGRWTKPGGAAVTNYVDSESVPVRLVPGNTWIVLAPTGATVKAS